MQAHVLRNRLIKHYENAPRAARQAGRHWYDNARTTARKLARDSGRSLAVSAGVIAALSPRAHWATNISWARDSLMSGAARGGLSTGVRKAQRIIDGERPLQVLSGPKVRAFYRAIMGHCNAAVVDVWIAYAVGVDSNGWSEQQYNKVAQALTDAAKNVGVPVIVFQATVWVAVRGSAN